MFKSNGVIRLLSAVSLFVGLVVFPVQADLGLQSILSGEGSVAVGKAVKTAVESIYASVDDPAEIESKLVEILNEAVATGDEEAIRYTIVAVMMAGGSDHLDLSKSAIDNSDAFSKFPDITVFTVSAAESILSATGSESGSSSSGDSGGGSQGSGASGEEGGGSKSGEELGGGSAKSDEELGGGSDSGIFDDGDSDIDDNDVPATPK